MEFRHQPVMLREVIELLSVRADGVYVDCTVGGGGHAEGILRLLGPQGTLVGLDRDPDALAAARMRLGNDPRVRLVRADFRRLASIMTELGIRGADGVLYDLGASSYQFDSPARGFTYWEDVPLDMRMDPEAPVTAAHLVNTLSAEELARVIREYGEEKWAGRIADFIVKERAIRPIETTGELVAVIKKAVPASARRMGPHPARRTFQALRIAVNQELDALKESLAQALALLKPGGRLVVLSYHSLEDRIVKEFIRAAEAACVCPPNTPVCVCGKKRQLISVTKRPRTPTGEELGRNPRSRSAKLRTAEKVAVLMGDFL
ncbi:MAG TPA: 16S rRNA (cytosine(1402)-N(4))-methyltransferase RsmH [Desulfotomaculum sp.]|nr:16S rRNA (cytosine(1402)-N(4))-methyltransferase RsmH [Desulfotomaculum sp.]